MSIQEILAQDTHQLRHKILRPHQTLDDCIYPGDDESQSFHIGGYVNDELICIASFFAQDTNRLPSKSQYRLRGMATLPEFRGRGIGAAVLSRGEQIATERGFEIIWCNARTSASGYYRKLGYISVGDEFEIEGIGPHYVMWKTLA